MYLFNSLIILSKRAIVLKPLLLERNLVEVVGLSSSYKKRINFINLVSNNSIRREMSTESTNSSSSSSTSSDLPDQLVDAKIIDAKKSNKHKIAICQITSKSDVNENFNVCKQLITEAKKQGAKMVFLPEACDYIESSVQSSKSKAQRIDGEFMTSFRKLAKELDIWISIGSFHRKNGDKDHEKLSNSHVVLDNQGEIKCINDKMHLFEANIKNGECEVNLKESDYTLHGKEFYMPLETPVGIIGSCICFDMRFPQLSTILRTLGAQIISYPSAFMVQTGHAHWEILLRARAIENQCYVVAPAQMGQHNEKRASYGHSMVIDPWGKIIADCGEESPTFKIVELDLDYLDVVRKSIPISNSFRSDLYLHMPIIKKKIDQEFYLFGDKIKLHNKIVFLETFYCIAFVNIKPVVPGHIVIIPKKKSLRVQDMSLEESVDLFRASRFIGSKLEKHFNATSLNFSIQDGPESGQTVEHVHMHILPRRIGDFNKDEIYDRLRDHDKDSSVRGRSLDEMIKEASELRKLFDYDD